MTDPRPFHFKHFSLYHHNATMKVGTDAVLLGRWVEVKPTDSCLDIGTGCGILPLMLMQKGANHVVGIDLDEASIDEAAGNCKASQWRDHLQAITADVKTFQPDHKFDLVISNPPFFINSYKCDADRKNQARHTDISLTFIDLCASASRLLQDDGRFAVVLPMTESIAFLKAAENNGLYLHKQMEIIPVEGKEPNRVNLELGFFPTQNIEKETFIIRQIDGCFTSQYDEFLMEFYLG